MVCVSGQCIECFMILYHAQVVEELRMRRVSKCIYPSLDLRLHCVYVSIGLPLRVLIPRMRSVSNSWCQRNTNCSRNWSVAKARVFFILLCHMFG